MVTTLNLFKSDKAAEDNRFKNSVTTALAFQSPSHVP